MRTEPWHGSPNPSAARHFVSRHHGSTQPGRRLPPRALWVSAELPRAVRWAGQVPVSRGFDRRSYQAVSRMSPRPLTPASRSAPHGYDDAPARRSIKASTASRLRAGAPTNRANSIGALRRASVSRGLPAS